jgi:hypothetical protein
MIITRKALNLLKSKIKRYGEVIEKNIEEGGF